MRNSLAIAGAALLALTACAPDQITQPVESTAAARGEEVVRAAATETVYVMTNAAGANGVLAYPRAADGSLGAPTEYATGGGGSGGGLGSQGALVLSDDGRWLLAVNAGSDEISIFRVRAGGLELTDRVPSGGSMPISVTIANGLVYALNAGGSGNISGFHLRPGGRLDPIPSSTRPLSSSASGPAQVEFNTHGRLLVVTEKATNRILTYEVYNDGTPSDPQVHDSAGQTPFGFAFHGDLLVVSEAFGGAADASATSSYELGRRGRLHLISGSVGTTETAACWVVITNDGRYAYVTNTGSGTVSGYAIGQGGRLTLLDADGETGHTGPGSGPIDADFSEDGRFLYVLNSGNGTVSAFQLGGGGALSDVPGAAGLPASAVGIAAH